MTYCRSRSRRRPPPTLQMKCSEPRQASAGAVYSGVYTVPAGQGTTEIRFDPIFPTDSAGNFFDAVQVKHTAPTILMDGTDGRTDSETTVCDLRRH